MFVFVSVLHNSQTVFMQIAKGKKKRKETMPLTSVINEEALIDLKCAKTYILNFWHWYRSFYKLFDLDAGNNSDLFFVVGA